MKPRSGHGGSRSGAGRKSIKKIDQLLIGARVATEWAELSEEAALEKHKASLPYADIEVSRKAIRDAAPDAADHRTWLAEELDGFRADGTKIGPYRRRISFKTPQGKKRSIIARVAADESRERGITISASQVRRCERRYVKFCKEHQADLTPKWCESSVEEIIQMQTPEGEPET